VRTLDTEGRVLAVAGVDPRLVGQPREELVADVTDERGEPRLVLLGVADTTGESGRRW
jgi:hypothetical protein